MSDINDEGPRLFSMGARSFERRSMFRQKGTRSKRTMVAAAPPRQAAAPYDARRVQSAAVPPIDPYGYSNSAEYKTIDDATMLLFYTETSEDVIFDVANDTALYDLFATPFEFSNRTSLSFYESLVTRARYYCRPHPQSDALARTIGAELALSASSLLVFVYKRDNARQSPVKQRRRSPFTNATNGLRAARQRSDDLLLFEQYTHEPRLRAAIVWHREPRLNSTVGLFAVELLELI